MNEHSPSAKQFFDSDVIASYGFLETFLEMGKYADIHTGILICLT